MLPLRRLQYNRTDRISRESGGTPSRLTVEDPVAIEPRKFVIFAPQSVLTDGVNFISGYLFDDRFIFRILSP